MRPRCFLAAVGDANSPVTWSGIPFYFLQSARAAGLIDEGLPLSTEGLGWGTRRMIWNMTRLSGGDRPGGYQYSTTFLERLWSSSKPHLQDSQVINCFQLFPPSIINNSRIKKWFFIDQTLIQLFDYYGLRSTVGRRIADEAVKRERDGYQAATGVMVHSKWAAESVERDYAVPRSRIHVVVPGASIDRDEYTHWETRECERRAFDKQQQHRPLRLVFVGKYWRRKGLDRLLKALVLARRQGSTTTLRIIGCRRENLPVELRDIKGVEWAGFIDKRVEAGKFLQAVGECDIGCLLSREEAGGIALREYHALGLPVLGTNTGGAPEHMLPDASVTVSVDATAEEISETLLSLEGDPTRLAELRNKAWQQRRLASWPETVRRIQEFWPHPGADLEIAGQGAEEDFRPEAQMYGSVA